jgi:hypothetical protein
MPLITALVSGLLFGAGLALSGMVNPAKVLNFLDLAGSFDPTLLFVLGGAVVTTFIGYRLLLPPRPLFAERFQWPTMTDVDGRLVAGAAVFGIGWARRRRTHWSAPSSFAPVRSSAADGTPSSAKRTRRPQHWPTPVHRPEGRTCSSRSSLVRIRDARRRASRR